MTARAPGPSWRCRRAHARLHIGPATGAPGAHRRRGPAALAARHPAARRRGGGREQRAGGASIDGARPAQVDQAGARPGRGCAHDVPDGRAPGRGARPARGLRAAQEPRVGSEDAARAAEGQGGRRDRRGDAGLQALLLGEACAHRETRTFSPAPHVRVGSGRASSPAPRLRARQGGAVGLWCGSVGGREGHCAWTARRRGAGRHGRLEARAHRARAPRAPPTADLWTYCGAAACCGAGNERGVQGAREPLPQPGRGC
eukprot:4939497-Prymnesium_polylepis.2